MKTILAGILLALPLLSQESTPDKKAVAEIVRYDERWPQKWTIRIVDAAAATELPGYRKILAQGIDADHIVIQKTYYVKSGWQPRHSGEHIPGRRETVQRRSLTNALE